jgi:pyruvate-formate lyase-activating enzyme
MAECDAHEGLVKSIEQLYDTQLFELTAQGEEHRKATDVRLDLILEKVGRLSRKPSLVKIAAVVVPALLGGGGVTALVTAFLKGGK